jgi:hypothetical protein
MIVSISGLGFTGRCVVDGMPLLALTPSPNDTSARIAAADRMPLTKLRLA